VRTAGLGHLVVAGLVNDQATTLLCESDLFEPVRDLAGKTHPLLGELVNCHVCAGMWIAFGQAAYGKGTVTLRPTRTGGFVGGLASFLFDALAIAAAGRLSRRLTHPDCPDL
jgi:hypothetical protein